MKKAKKKELKQNKFLLKLIKFLEKEFDEILINERTDASSGYEFTHKHGDSLLKSIEQKMSDFVKRNNAILIESQVFPGSSCYIPKFYVNDLKTHQIAICNRQDCFTLSEETKNVNFIDKIKLLFLFNKGFNVLLKEHTANQIYLHFSFQQSKINPAKRIESILSNLLLNEEINDCKIERKSPRLIKFEFKLKNGDIKNGYINISKSSFEVKIK